MNKQIFTPDDGENQAFESFIESLLTTDNLKLKEPQYKPTPEEEIEIEAWLEQDKKPKVKK